MNKKLDKNTVGKSPAAIYLIEVLDTSSNLSDKKVLKKIDSFHGIFKSFVLAYEAGNLPSKAVKSFIYQKKIILNMERQEMLCLGYSPLVVDLYVNLIQAEMKKFINKTIKIQAFEKDAKARATQIVQQSVSQGTVSTFGQRGQEMVPVEVSFNKYGRVTAVLDKTLITDDKAQTLIQKAQARRAKKDLALKTML